MRLPVLPDNPKGMFVVLLPTLECNLACSYCFEKHPTGRWDEATTAKIIGQIVDLAKHERAAHLRLHWQGGESLLLGPEYWSSVLAATEETCRSAGLELDQSMQTNLTLYSAEAGAIIKRYLGGKVGTSFEDTPGRRFLTGDHTKFVKAWAKANERARADGIEVGVITLLNDAAMAEGAPSFLRRMRDDYGIHRLRINLPFQQHDAGGYWVDAFRAGDFLRDAYRWWIERGRDDYLHLKPMRYLEDKLVRGESREPGLCIFSQNCSDVALTVTTKGDVTLCDSFAFTDQAPAYGNLFSDGLVDIYQGAVRKKVRSMCQSLVTDLCAQCRFLPMCYGGCLVRSHGTDTSDPYFHYCETYKTLFSEIERQNDRGPHKTHSQENAWSPIRAV